MTLHPKIPSTVQPKFVHPIQPTVTSSEDLDINIGQNEQLHVFDSITFNNDVVIEGELCVMGTEEADVFLPGNSGIITLPTIVDHGDGSATFGTGRCALRSHATEPTSVKWYDILGATFVFANNETTYVYYDYNSGVPVIRATTTRSEVADNALMSKFILATVNRFNAELDIITWDRSGIGCAEKRLNRAFDTEMRFERSLSTGGLIITDTGSHTFAVSASKIWTVLEAINVDAISSSVDEVWQWQRDGSGNWTYTIVSVFNYLQYQNVLGGLSTLTNNRFAINYLWRTVSATRKRIHILLGSGDYRLIDAQAENRPTPPRIVSSSAIYIGRIIIEKNAASVTQIDSAFDVAASGTPIILHNETLLRDTTDCHPISAITNGAGTNVSNTFDEDQVFLGDVTSQGNIEGSTGHFGGSTHYSEFESDGTLVMHGDATIYDDIYIPMSTGKLTGVGDPTWTTFTTNTAAYRWAVNDKIDLPAIEMLHGWAEGTDIEVHIHWATNGANDATPRGAKWEVYYAIANMESAGGTVTFSEATLTQASDTVIAASEPNKTHKYSSVGTITMTGFKIGAVIKMRIKRIAASGTAPANDPFGLMVGIHHKKDTIGSRSISAK